MAIQENKTLPDLRFPEFTEDWTTERCDYFLARNAIPVSISTTDTYTEIGIKSHGRGVFHKQPITCDQIGNKRVFEAVPGALSFNIVFAWEQALAVLTDQEKGLIASHRFPMFVSNRNRASVDFFKHFFLRPRGKWLLELASPGGAGRNKTLGQSSFAELQICAPSVEEQSEIANFLDLTDQKISSLKSKIELLEQYRRGCLESIFSQEIRFQNDDGDDFPEWETKRLGDVLTYEQPTKYLVSSTEYSDQYQTPVLTAGKTFILGYTDETDGIFTNIPAIIFDDFTTSFQFVDFPFKAKSSAMKMLTRVNPKDSIRFIHAAMQQIRFQVGDHKRYWIAEYQNEEIGYPHPEEQAKIAKFLRDLDQKIASVSQELKLAQTFKKGLLQQMFV